MTLAEVPWQFPYLLHHLNAKITTSIFLRENKKQEVVAHLELYFFSPF